ncbi:peptidase inhibitor family I36 protein [Streptomyces hygroscopicus]|uniref:peptidase inhibitor family I36 protein n=1 Tax=Streptomyces TaxID=1883 RepID=UPI00209E6521|nr:peptidase inhibitor family I36 protein [Streptomyces sp. RKCA744]MCO8308479.1 peptidase inhibitor family I36 protein [Streptomyces sp. RKCA744]
MAEVCIHPEINFVGQPWVRRAVDGSVNDLPTAIRDGGSAIRNNFDRTARVYEKRNFAGRWVCVTRSGGSIHDLRSYHLKRPDPLTEAQPQRLRLRHAGRSPERDRAHADGPGRASS